MRSRSSSRLLLLETLRGIGGFLLDCDEVSSPQTRVSSSSISGLGVRMPREV